MNTSSRVGGRAALRNLGLTILCVLYFYLLSVGPSRWLARHGYFFPGFFEAAYFPILLLARTSSWFNAVLQWYLAWWGG